jgi:hypothetical protein
MEMGIVKANLWAALGKPGCPFCRLRHEVEGTYIRRLLFDYVNDGMTRLSLVRSGGLCSHHAWLVQGIEQVEWGDGLKTATLYESAAIAVQRGLTGWLGGRPTAGTTSEPGRRWGLAKRAARLLRHLLGETTEPGPAERLLDRLAPRQACPVCAPLQRQEAALAGALCELAQLAEGNAALRAADGLCLPHWRLALAAAPTEEVATTLAAAAQAQLALLQRNLQGYQEKHRWEDRSLLAPEEAAAWIRLVAFFAGEAPISASPEQLQTRREEALQQYALFAHRAAETGRPRRRAS